METGEHFIVPHEKGGRVYVRVSGPQVGLNKTDKGDRPCMYVFANGEEVMGHEVLFHGPVTLRQEFEEGCPTTGAILWLESKHGVTLTVRENHDLHAHVQAKREGLLDDVPRS